MDKKSTGLGQCIVSPIRANVQYATDAKDLAYIIAGWMGRTAETDRGDSKAADHCVGYMAALLVNDKVQIGISYCNIGEHYYCFDKHDAIQTAKFKASRSEDAVTENTITFIKRISRAGIIELDHDVVWEPTGRNAIKAEHQFTAYLFNYLPIEQLDRFIDRVHRYFSDKEFSDSAKAIEAEVTVQIERLNDEIAETESRNK